MADKKHLEILKQGIEAWNRWREKNLDIGLDLSKADLRGTDLKGADLSYADLRGAHLSYADLRGADLRRINLTDAGLRGADLTGAELHLANLSRAPLTRTIFTNSNLWGTLFTNNDLSKAIDLERVEHRGPSYIGTSTLKNSGGFIPDVFLRGCGLSNWEIESAKLYQTNLSTDEIDNILYRVHDLRVGQAIQISPLFISYTHADGKFVDAIERCLNKRGVRFWRDIHHATSGRLEKVIDSAIKHNPTVLLVLSKNSVNSDWVQHEARLARKLEIETGRDVLCPVALDNSWEGCKWPKRLREQIMEYHILDFSNWKDRSSLDRMFSRLIKGLDLFYTKPQSES